jgi:hypothetical protein
MPVSQPRILSSVHTLIKELKPRSIIDIGIGHGKTGVILREYLDIMKERYKPEDWQTKIYGVEIFSDYRNPLWNYAYDMVLAHDAFGGLNKLPDVDLILALDVWEHFESEYASKMLNLSLNKARYLLISTPKDPLHQSTVLSNAYERHVSRWTPKDFRHIPFRLFTCTAQDWIILLSSRSSFPLSVVRHCRPLSKLTQSLKEALSIWKQALRCII